MIINLKEGPETLSFVVSPGENSGLYGLDFARRVRDSVVVNLRQIPGENLQKFIRQEILAFKRFNWEIANGVIPVQSENFGLPDIVGFREDTAAFFKTLDENHLLTMTQKQYLVESCQIPVAVFPDYTPGELAQTREINWQNLTNTKQLLRLVPRTIKEKIFRVRNEKIDETTARRKIFQATGEVAKSLKKLGLSTDNLFDLEKGWAKILNGPLNKKILKLVREAETSRALTGIFNLKRGPARQALLPDFVKIVANTAAVKTSESWDNIENTNPFSPRPHTRKLAEIYHHIYDLPETKNRERQRKILRIFLPAMLIASGFLYRDAAQGTIRAWNIFSQHPQETTRALVDEGLKKLVGEEGPYTPEEVAAMKEKAERELFEKSKAPKPKTEMKKISSVPVKGPNGENLVGYIEVPKNTPEEITREGKIYSLSRDRVSNTGLPVYTNDRQTYFRLGEDGNLQKLEKEIVSKYTFMAVPPKELIYTGQKWQLTNLNALGEPVWQKGDQYLTVIGSKVRILTLDELVQINKQPIKPLTGTIGGAHRDRKVPLEIVVIPETAPAVADIIEGPITARPYEGDAEFGNFPKYRLRWEGSPKVANIYYLAPDNSLRRVGFIDEINHFKIEDTKQVSIPGRPGEFFWELTFLPGSQQYVDGYYKPLLDPQNHKIMWGLPDALLIQDANEATDRRPTIAFRDAFRPGYYKVDPDKGKIVITQKVRIASTAWELETQAAKIQQLLKQGKNTEAGLVQQQFDAAHFKTYEKDISREFFKLNP